MMEAVYLSRMLLNERSKAVREDLRDGYAMHRRIAGLVGAASVAGGPRPLYRVDRTVVLLQSLAVPDWSSLPESYLLDSSDDLGFGVGQTAPTKRIDEGLSALCRGMTLQFKLMAWPTVAVHGESKGSRPARIRRQITGIPGLLAWLQFQGDFHGFELAVVNGQPDVHVSFRPMQTRSAGKPIAWPRQAVVYEGLLRVRDADALRQTVLAGIGRGKTFGLGLLSLSRM